MMKNKVNVLLGILVLLVSMALGSTAVAHELDEGWTPPPANEGDIGSGKGRSCFGCGN
jgi:hypothetical protein